MKDPTKIEDNKEFKETRGIMKKAKRVLNKCARNQRKLIGKLTKTCDEIGEDIPVVELEQDNIKGALEYYKISRASRTKAASVSRKPPHKLDQLTQHSQQEDNLEDLHWFNQMYQTEDQDKFFMKDIIGYDGDFKQKCKAWMKKHLKNVEYEDQRKDYYAFRASRHETKIKH